MSEALVLLVLLWAVLLVPSALKNRTSSPHATVGGFERAMDVLRTPHRSGTGRELLVPGEGAGRIVSHAHVEGETRPFHREDPLVAGRRLTFTRLLAASAVTIVVALVVGGALWWVAVAALAVTTGYAWLLRRWKLQRDAARAVVRELEVPRTAVAPAEPQRVPVAAGAVGDERTATGAVRLRRWDT